MSLREEQCNKVCRILDDVLANRPTERDSLIAATRSAFSALSDPHWIPVTENTLPETENMYRRPTKRYLCQRESGGVRQFFVGARLCDPKGYLKDWWDWYGVKIHNAEVVAYMPLPEPYKGVTE